MATKCKYTSQGREIFQNGKPFVSITREGDTRPVDADLAVRRLVKAMNRSGDCFVWTSSTLDGPKPRRNRRRK